ncbi:arginyl-tRNA--protein transferase 1 [[Candida] railenensis]|uniref:arginyltransferase n=1 Tax=[Candida] railenensis TaxID=45579 RepID=A0A9P0W0H5_9ASCO|nr:arginyl-tRNA--protein transferase 1 [[Candida] railenensis]
MQYSDLLLISRPIYISSGDCGYCKGKKDDPYALESWFKNRNEQEKKPSSITIGFSVERMSCSTYDSLMNIGYRRSGTFLYKPDLLRGCCRLFTIRTNMKSLKLGKQQRQTINRFMRAIGGGEQIDAGTKNKNSANYSTTTQTTESNLIPVALENLFALERNTNEDTFYTRFGPSKFTKEKFLLYKKYQMRVHGDKEEDVSEGSFKRFLCDTPFSDEEVLGDEDTWNYLNHWNEGDAAYAKKKRIGPTHECYYFKGKLIAISILDFLPSGVSSIYFIWDPDYPQLSLGTLSGLREIYMCEKLNLGYYYLGYYVDDCVKMKYKKRFGGEVLDIARMEFAPFDKLDSILKGGRYFTIQSTESESTGEAIKESAIDLDKFPSDFSKSRSQSPIVNDAERVYHPKSPIFTAAEHSTSKICSQYGVNSNRNAEIYHKIPDVVPGLIPTSQLLAQFETDKIYEQSFLMLRNGIVMVPFSRMTGEEKRIIVDCIRLLGLETTLRTIVLF